MTERMKQDMIAFFTDTPDRFALFCMNLLEGKPVYWCDYCLTDNETIEIYQNMRKVFPGRIY